MIQKSHDDRMLWAQFDALEMGTGWEDTDILKPQIMIESVYGDSHRSPQIRNGRYLNNPYEKTAPFHAAKGRRAGRAAEGYHLGARREPFSGFFAL